LYATSRRHRIEADGFPLGARDGVELFFTINPESSAA